LRLYYVWNLRRLVACGAKSVNIENMRQNHPELVVRDLARLGVPEEQSRHILKMRGINKWLCVRRLLIQLKNRWKGDITVAQKTIETHRAHPNLSDCSIEYVRGWLAATEQHRAQVRALCHSDRDIDFPRVASDWPTEAHLPVDFSRPSKRTLRRQP